MTRNLDLISPTKRKAMTKPRAAKIFLREQGRCYLCGLQLRPGVHEYQIEHPDPLCLGGSDDDADLRVVCIPCHKAKTKQDVSAKANRDRVVTSGWQRDERRSSFQSRGFQKASPQRSASRPIIRRNEQP